MLREGMEPPKVTKGAGSLGGDISPLARAVLEQGWQVNRKRTQRVWREEGLRCLTGGASAGGWESPARC